MKLTQLNQFDEESFNTYFGLYTKEIREKSNLSQEHLASKCGLWSPEKINQIECGQYRLLQEDFETLIFNLNLNVAELTNISKITQIRFLMDVYKETNENFPNV